MNSTLSFNEIYFKCNSKALYEQVLKEMGTYDKMTIAKRLGKFLKEAREAFDRFATSYRANDNYTAIHAEEDNHINTAINKTVKSGLGTDPDPNAITPFRVRIDPKTIIDENNLDEIDNWTTDMTTEIPKAPEDDNNHRHGFSIEKIKNRFVAIYRGLFNPN